VSDRVEYVAAVLALYGELPDTPQRVSASDHWLANCFHADGIPLAVVETALLLGTLRRRARPPEAPLLAPVRSLAYFRPVVEELRSHPAPDGYLEYLRLKLRRTATGQISTFSDDR
jgi:hypothetical protein